MIIIQTFSHLETSRIEQRREMKGTHKTQCVTKNIHITQIIFYLYDSQAGLGLVKGCENVCDYYCKCVLLMVSDKYMEHS